MHRHVKTVHADFKGDETIDDRENPEIIDEDDASDKAETDDSDIDVEEVEEAAAEEEEAGKEEVSDDRSGGVYW